MVQIFNYLIAGSFKLISMGITKQYLKSKPVCKVTFVVQAMEAEEVRVVGDFNNWDSSVLPLKRLKNGNFKGTYNLPRDHSFEFKYLVDGRYINEPNADSYRWNSYAGSENSVLEL